MRKSLVGVEDLVELEMVGNKQLRVNLARLQDVGQRMGMFAVSTNLVVTVKLRSHRCPANAAYRRRFLRALSQKAAKDQSAYRLTRGPPVPSTAGDRNGDDPTVGQQGEAQRHE
jgi:hypothetical protein